jgi:hypothetical protein
MEQKGVLLRGIASVLNAGGSALLNIYDVATSIKTIVLPGEKGTLSAQLRDYEKKLELLYGEIGKEVVLREDNAGLSAAGEAGIKRAAECQAEIEKIKQRIQKITADEKAALAAKKEAAQECAAARPKRAPEAATEETEDVAAGVTETPLGEMAAEATETVDEPTDKTPEKSVDTAVEVAETVAPEMVADLPESAEPEAAGESTDMPVAEAEIRELEMQEEAVESEMSVAGETSAAVETEGAAVIELETLPKSDLMQMCSEKGIEVDKKMTKAEIIALISGL